MIPLPYTIPKPSAVMIIPMHTFITCHAMFGPNRLIIIANSAISCNKLIFLVPFLSNSNNRRIHRFYLIDIF